MSAIRCADCAHATAQYRQPGSIFCARLRGHRAPLERRWCEHYSLAPAAAATVVADPPELPAMLRRQAC